MSVLNVVFSVPEEDAGVVFVCVLCPACVVVADVVVAASDLSDETDVVVVCPGAVSTVSCVMYPSAISVESVVQPPIAPIESVIIKTHKLLKNRRKFFFIGVIEIRLPDLIE